MLHEIRYPNFDENGNLPYGLADGIFGKSAVLMTTTVPPEASEDVIKLYLRLKSIRQPIELQYGNFFNKFQLFKDESVFNLFKKAECAYRTAIVGFFVELSHLP